MLNRALVKLLFIAFWGAFFHCQPAPVVAQSESAQPHKSGFCKKKLINDQKELTAVSVILKVDGRPDLSPDPGFIGTFVQALVCSLHVSPLPAQFAPVTPNCWLTLLGRIHPNKAPPVVRLV